MTSEEAITKYEKKFGGFPYFLFMGAEDSYIVETVTEALKSGKEIEVSDEGDY